MSFSSPIALPIQTLKDIITKPLPPVEWLVKPVMAKGERVLVYGEYGSFKSYILLHMALHLAAGKNWLDTFEIPAPCSVLYIDEEMGDYTLKHYVHRLMRGTSIELTAPFAALSGEGIMLTDVGAKVLLDRIERTDFKPQVVILEALRRVMPGNENEAADVAAFWRAIKPISKAGIAVMVSHHMNKPPVDAPRANRYRASGSTDLIAGSTTAWAVTRVNGQDTAIMEAIRIRLMKEPPPFAIDFAFQGETGPVHAKLGEDPAQASLGGQAVLLIEKAIKDRGPQETHVLEALCASEGISRKTVYRALSLLQDEGRAYNLGGGVWGLPEHFSNT